MDHDILNGFYQLKNTIGSGGFGKVKLAIHNTTGEKVAIKIMSKRFLGKDLPRVKTEIEALKVLNHKNICRLYEVIETEDYFYIVLEYCQGGELFDYIVAKDRLSEVEGRTVFREIVEAVAYIHSRGFVHRDLKPENLLLDEDKNIKVIDFGLCAQPEGGIEAALKTCCGSPAYAAPELILGKSYMGTQVDLWSMGVLLYSLLCGSLPFDDKNLSTLYKKILNGKYHNPRWLTKETVSLLRNLLQVDPQKRFTIADLVNDPWMNRGYLCPVGTSFESKSEAIDEDCVTEMSVHYILSREDVRARVAGWKYDYTTSTYLLLLRKKTQGRPVRLVRPRPLRVNQEQTLTPARPLTKPTNIEVGGSNSTDDSDDGADVHLKFDVRGRPKCALQLRFDRADLPGGIRWDQSPTRERGGKSDEKASEVLEEKKENFQFLRPRTPKARHRPITVDGSRTSPSRGRKPSEARVPHKGTPRPSRNPHLSRYVGPSNPLSPSRSMDSQLNQVVTDTEKSNNDQVLPSSSMESNVNSEGTPSRSKPSRMAASVFGSLERSMDKLRVMLTPKKSSSIEGPRMVKRSTHNVFGLSPRNAENLVESLETVLTKLGITHRRDGYFFKIKALSGKEKVKMELEVVMMPPDYCGYISKRIKGSSWLYKNWCDSINEALKPTNPQPA